MTRRLGACIAGALAGALFLAGQAFPEHFGAILFVTVLVALLAGGIKLWRDTAPTHTKTPNSRAFED